MKFNSLKKGGFTLVQIMIVIVLMALLAAFAIPKLSAQPYFTNTTAATGGYQYNDGFTASQVPSAVINRQKLAGIITGTSVTAADGTVTNSFGSVVYTAPPNIQVTQVGTIITTTNVVTLITTTNFVFKAGAGSVTNNWVSIGR
ncbi:MAG: hypothetical protein WCH84_11575 [Verrucomicrobiota bacterium]